VIPEGVVSLDAFSFYYCDGVKSVTIPASMVSVGSMAFLGCGNLEQYIVEPGNETYSAEYGVLYSAEKDMLVSYPNAKTGDEFNVPETVQYIAEGAFFGNENLKKITIPESVVAFGEGVFSNCRSLKSVNIPSKVAEITDSMFCDCYSLSEITIPDSVTYISDYAFLECTSLKSLTVSDNVTQIGEKAIGFYDDSDGKFKKIDGFTLKANFDSAAKRYAKDNGIDIDYLDGNKNIPYIIIISAVIGAVIIGIIIIIVHTVRKKKKEHEYYSN